MKRLKLFFACLLMAVLSIGQMWAVDDVINNAATSSALGSTGTTTWKSPDPVIVGASGASYTIHSMGTQGTSNALQFNKNGFLYQTTSGGTLASVTIKGAAKKFNIYASNSAYSGKATGTALTQITASSTGVTYTFTSNYKYLAINGTESSSSITEITVTYSTSGGDPVPVTGVSLDEDDIVLEVGETQTLVATIEPGEATDQVVSWESDDENVASVDENGVVTAEGIGTATITVTTHDGDFTATCDVEVIAVQPKSSLILEDEYKDSGATAEDGAEWVVTSDAPESTYEAARGIHFGTGSTSQVQYVQLTTSDISGTITKVVVNASDATGTAEISVSVGGTDFTCSGSTTVANTNPGSNYIFTGSASGEIVVLIDRGDAAYKAIYVKSIVVTYEPAAPAAVEKPTIEGENNFLSTTTITLSCETTGAEIRYTTNGDAPTSASTLYEAPFTLDATATVKAIAILGSDASEVEEKAFTKLTTYTTIPAMYEAADSETLVGVTFDNWVVSGVSANGKNVYVTDNTNGFIIFNNDGGLDQHFAVGNVLSGTVKCKLLKYYGAAELKELNSETAGLNIATGGTITQNTTQLNELSGVNTGSLISISGACTNPNGNIYKVNDVQLYNALYAFANPTAGSNYNVSGIYVYHSTYGNEICPRRAEDIVEQQEKQNANTQWVATSKTVRMGDATTNWWSTSSDGEKSFISTNEAVATITAEGAITLVAPGTTTLKFSTAATDTYFAGPEVSMVLTVKAALPAGASEFTWVAAEMGVENSTAVTTATGNEDPISIVFGGTGTSSKYYTSGYSVRTYEGNTMTIATKSDAKLIYEIDFTFDGDKNFSANKGNLSADKFTWTGLEKEVVFTTSGGQARFKTITVVYADGTVTSLSIEDINLKTTDGETALAITKNVEATIIYEGLDENVATISDNKVNPVGEGSTTVTARIEKGSNYTAAETTFTITVAAKQIPAMSFPQNEYNANLGVTFTAPTLTKPDGVSVKYSSNNAAVSVDENTGAITLNAEGTGIVITATSVENDDYAVNTASYTLNVIDPYKDVLTATGIGQSGYGTWSDKTFTTATEYAGNTTTGAGDKSGTIQMRVQNPSGIVNTSTIGYVKEISATATKNSDKTLDIYAKNTPYGSSADLYDESTRGTLIGTIAAGGGSMVFEDGLAYSDNYKYIGIKAKGGAVYYDEIVIKWTPATINKYTVTYKAGEASGDDVVINNVEEGTPITLAAADTYSKDGYTFMGWNDGTQTYAAGASYTINDDVTFTAQWAQNFTVTYKAGEAGETQVVRTVPAGAYNLESCSFAYANHAFDGWQNGANKYNAGAEVNISGNMEFVATWVEAMDPITVTFIVNVEKGSKSIYKEGVNVSVSGGDLSRTDNYRCYGNETMTISSELGNIIGIELTCTAEGTANYGPGKFSATNYTYDSYTGTWAGSEASVELAAASQVRMTEIQVTYIPSAYQRNVTAGNFGTICLPFNGTIEGAELLEFVDKDANNIYLGDADATVQAGKPYIFRATADQIKVSFTGNSFEAAGDHNGLYGTYVYMDGATLSASTGNYIISNNLYYEVDDANCSLKAYRAYFKKNEVPGTGSNNARRRYALGNGAPQVVTGMDELNASEAPVKMIIDGQLFIIRGEKMFDATGRLIK